MSSPMTPEQLAARLSTAADRRGIDRRPVTLTAASTAMALLGAPECSNVLSALSTNTPETTRLALTKMWQLLAKNHYPYLTNYLDQIIGWLPNAHMEAMQSLQDAFGILAETDLRAVVEHPQVQGDLLGQILTYLQSPAERTSRGAFYTPPSVARLIAGLTTLPRPGETVLEPACGCGGMIIAVVREMRAAGRCPELVTWHLNDIDRTSVALAGVAMASHGIPDVVLTADDALARSLPGGDT